MRKGTYYAQLDANNGKQSKYPLHGAETVPQAITETQVLKKLRRDGKLLPPTEMRLGKKEDKNESTEGHLPKEAIAEYKKHREEVKIGEEKIWDRAAQSLMRSPAVMPAGLAQCVGMSPVVTSCPKTSVMIGGKIMKKSFSSINRVWIAALVCSGFCAANSRAQTARPQRYTIQPRTVSSAAQDPTAGLLKSMARNNDMEVAVMEVGARKAQNADLKRFCEEAQQEQIQMNEQLKPVARQHGVTIDRSLTKRDEAELAKLQSSGSKLDHALAGLLVREQANNLRKLQQASTEPVSSDVKEYIDQTLPKATQELKQAQAAAAELGLGHVAHNKRHIPKAVGGAGEIQ